MIDIQTSFASRMKFNYRKYLTALEVTQLNTKDLEMVQFKIFSASIRADQEYSCNLELWKSHFISLYSQLN